jgi:hypothetical protein
MKFQKQKFKHAPANGTIGDCHRTCVAMMLDLDRDEVPHWTEENWENVPITCELEKAWLKERGYAPLYLKIFAPTVDEVLNWVGFQNPDQYYIFTGKSANGLAHCVIALGDTIVFDPAIDDSGIVGPLQLEAKDGSLVDCYEYEFLVPIGTTAT